MSIKAAVYPFDRDFVPVFHSKELLKSIEIVSLISLPGWGYTDGIGISSKETHPVICDFEIGIEMCDVLWICDSWNTCPFEQFILPAVRNAVEKQKKIFLTRNLTPTEISKIRVIAGDSLLTLEEYQEEKIPQTTQSNRLLSRIDTPVIYVAGVAQNTKKFEIQATLKGRLEQDGYNVLWLSSRKEALLMGGHSLPSFLLQNEISENRKILSFNNYVCCLEKEEKPSVILIGIPGSIMLYSKKYSHDFGILGYEMLQAIEPDCLVLGSLYFPYCDVTYFEGIERAIENKFDIPVDVHVLSEFTLDKSESLSAKEMTYLTLDESFVENIVKKMDDLRIFSLVDERDKDNLYKAVIQMMTGDMPILL